MSKLIIDNPTGASWIQRLTQRSLTLVFWVIFGLLFRPVLTLLAWLAGGYFATESMVHQQGFAALLEKGGLYLLVIALISALLLGWAWYNLLRFRNNERRTRQPAPVSVAAQAALYGLEEGHLARLQQQRRLVLEIDEQGRPVLPPDLPSRVGD
jgi:biofilm PGA synthesis protein PgaD